MNKKRKCREDRTCGTCYWFIEIDCCINEDSEYYDYGRYADDTACEKWKTNYKKSIGV